MAFRTSRTSLTGKSVLITGAARGIGAALARKAAARGARVALVGLEPEELARVADELGPEHLWVEADVTDPEALEAAVQRTVDTFGGLDVVVANAGIAPLTTVMTSSAHALARTIEVNLTGAMLTVHAALPFVAKRQRARADRRLGGVVHRAAGHERLLRLQGRRRAVRRRAAAGGGAPRGDGGQRPPHLDRHRPGARHRGRTADVRRDPQGPPRARWARTPPSRTCAEALVENLETRGRRVFVPRSLGVVVRLPPGGHRRARREAGPQVSPRAGAPARAGHRRAGRARVRHQLRRRPRPRAPPSSSSGRRGRRRPSSGRAGRRPGGRGSARSGGPAPRSAPARRSSSRRRCPGRPGTPRPAPSSR